MVLYCTRCSKNNSKLTKLYLIIAKIPNNMSVHAFILYMLVYKDNLPILSSQLELPMANL